MAYDIFPKSEKELEEATKDFSKEVRSELMGLFAYLSKKFPTVETPINLDKTKKTSVNITRALQEDVRIDTIKTTLKIKKLVFKFGNGSSGNRGAANRGNLFEPQFAANLQTWYEGGDVTDKNMLEAIEHIADTYDLRKAKDIKIDIKGGENTPRPLQYSATGITLKNTKGTGNDVGPSVTDITITKYVTKTKTEEIYLSLKVGGTVTFFNVGLRTVLTPEEIKKNRITNKEGLMLLDLFGIDPALFCMVFNGKLKKGVIKKNTVNKNKLTKLLKSGIGYGYHVVHKVAGGIISKQMDEKALDVASRIGNSVVYYGGKTGNGKRIDIEVESAHYKFKLNIRDTQGKDGYPTRLMCDFTHKNK
jgi:hypothetical protein